MRRATDFANLRLELPEINFGPSTEAMSLVLSVNGDRESPYVDTA
jgi:hypothetical protein